MRSIKVRSVSKTLNGEKILNNLTLSIPEGKFFALLGPSGCGKTTLLRLIGGFETVDEGEILLGNVAITHQPIHERSINTVFQNYALFPHLNVFENVAFSLKIKKVSSKEIYKRVMEMLTLLHIENHAQKGIQQLSGGQQQRVALARAIIDEPDVLLLDEPLAALDFKLREKVLIELIELQDKLKMTFVYVTHDQLEALTVADQMAIMNQEGQIEQIGTPREIYEFPVSSFVAQFVGSTNIFKGILKMDGDQNQPGRVHLPEIGDCFVDLRKDKNPEWHTFTDSQEVTISLRPEKILISHHPQEGFSNQLRGIVEAIVYHGRSTQYNIRLPNHQLIQVFEQNEEHFPIEEFDYDEAVYLYWQKENALLLHH